MQQFHWSENAALPVRARDRLNAYEKLHRFLARNFYTCRIAENPAAPPGLQIHARIRSLDGFAIARGVSTAVKGRIWREAAGIASDGRDSFCLFMPLRGGFEVSQFERTQDVEQGSCVLASAAEPGNMGASKGGESDVLSFLMPREFVDQRVASGESFCARPYEAGEGLRRLVFETLQAFEKSSWTLPDDDFQNSGRIVADLALLALGGCVDLLSGERSVRAGNLGRVKRIIRRRLSEPDLTLADIAREAGLSLAYLHKLFRDEGRTLWEYLKGERLRLARQLLESSSLPGMTITAVCLECGFSNASHFSTSFKRAFGVSPRDVRREGRAR